MTISFFSFLMSVLFSTALILAIHFLRNRPFFLRAFGAHTLFLLYGLCLFRMVFVIEMPFTVEVGLRGGFSKVYAWVRDAKISADGFQISLTGVLSCIWVVTAAVLFARFLWREYTVRRGLACYAENKNFAAEQTLKIVMGESARKFSVSVRICPDIDVPMGLGLFHKMIYLPDEEYAEKELYYILKHEYTHFSNQDFAVKLLTVLFRSVFWWNPAVYLLKRDVDQILEIKCDVNATRDFTKKERLEYLLTIIRVLRGDASPESDPPSMLATGLLSKTEHDAIWERFEVITKATKRIGLRYQAALVGLAAVMTILSYSFVFQSAFDPPTEDIYTDDSSIQEFDAGKEYLVRNKDGTYSLVFENGDIIPIISKEALEVFIEDGYPIREE